MNKILVPTDFSDNAINAINYATQIARRSKAKVIIFHAFQIPVMDTSVPAFMVQSMVEEEEQRCMSELKNICEEVSKQKYKDGSGYVQCEAIVRQGFAVEEVLFVSEEENTDLIVMGTQGASGLKRIILGSNTALVIEKSACPVLAVPSDAVYSTIKKVVYATEIQKGDFDTLKKITDFCRIYDCELILLHIGDENDSFVKEKLEELTKKIVNDLGIKKADYKIVLNDDVLEGINEYVKSHEVDIIAMVTHKRNLFARLFSSSLTNKMAFHTEVPLLSYCE